jgi:hypothetical protein
MDVIAFFFKSGVVLLGMSALAFVIALCIAGLEAAMR